MDVVKARSKAVDHMLSIKPVDESFKRQTLLIDDVKAKVKKTPHIYLRAIIEGLMDTHDCNVDYIETMCRHEAQDIENAAVVEAYIGSEEDMKNDI